MALTGIKKEMLFILGLFLSETGRKFGNAPLKISIPKVEFIDGIMKLNVVSKQKRAIYRNLESLENDKYIVYVERGLKFTRKGLAEFRRITKEEEFFLKTREGIKSASIGFRRKIQTQLS
ncbi:hypothetical protein KY362_07940 [Candidatus Woesearchaeota archaeon]|nr:hypothetical protein [Candidatus Woesearchaeota archaeon]